MHEEQDSNYVWEIAYLAILQTTATTDVYPSMIS